MGKQINFFLTRNDTILLNKTLLDIEGVEIYRRASDDETLHALNLDSLDKEIGEHFSYIISKREFTDKIKMNYINSINKYKISTEDSPVCEYMPCRFEELAGQTISIKRGRIYISDGYKQYRNAWGGGFSKWASLLIESIKKTMSEFDGYFYYGHEASLNKNIKFLQL